MYRYIENGSVTTPQGFKAAGIFCGIKKKRKDLALITSDVPCTPAGVFTTNMVQAAPVLLSKDVVGNNNVVSALVCNSGNANACTGEQGYKDALQMQMYTAGLLGVSKDSVIVSSTGVIGQTMPMKNVMDGIEKVIPELSYDGGNDAAEAIMTTDTKMKSFAVEIPMGNANVKIGCIAKGSGMIMPNMATMLAFLTTDVKVEKSLLQEMLTAAINKSFNKISVDGETSTNDMAIILSNGVSGVEIFAGSEKQKVFQEALNDICIKAAKSIVSDGEGATKLITINVTGADSNEDANLVGKTIANSPLVKTAIYGEDANWGRILSSAGMSGAKINASKTSVFFNDLPVLLPNYQIVLDEEKAAKVLAEKEFSININLNGGAGSATWWTCDFTEDYVKINSRYRT